MKKIKDIVVIGAFFFMSNMSAVPMLQQMNTSFYKNFVKQYRGEVITADNNVSMQWVQGAVSALRQGGTIDLQDLVVLDQVARFLWQDIWELGLKYYVGSSEITMRIWQSLNRNLDELRRQSVRPLPAVPQKTDPVDAGIVALRNFRMQTAERIKSSPTYFYSAGSVQQSWLREALRLVLNNNQIALNQSNKSQIQGEITSTVIELMGQVLRNDPRNLSEQQKNTILQMVQSQVEQFINTQMSGQQQAVVPSSPHQDGVVAGITALRNFRMQTAERIKSSPTYFYSAGSVQQSWLREALKLVLNNNQIALNQSNKSQIQGEITSTVIELMGHVLRNDPRNLSEQQKNAILQMVRYQVEQFINTQMSGQQQTAAPSSPHKDGVSAGIEALRNFRMQTAEIIKNSPAYFYSAGSVQQSWLREALKLVLNNNQIALNQSNKSQIQGEITSTAVELMSQLLRSDRRNLSAQQKNAILQMVRYQVEQFIKSQPMARL